MNRRSLLKIATLGAASLVQVTLTGGLPRAMGQTIPNMFFRKRVATNAAFPQTVASQPLGYACLGGTPL